MYVNKFLKYVVIFVKKLKTLVLINRPFFHKLIKYFLKNDSFQFFINHLKQKTEIESLLTNLIITFLFFIT